jgi:hypothetical protein
MIEMSSKNNRAQNIRRPLEECGPNIFSGMHRDIRTIERIFDEERPYPAPPWESEELPKIQNVYMWNSSSEDRRSEMDRGRFYQTQIFRMEQLLSPVIAAYFAAGGHPVVTDNGGSVHALWGDGGNDRFIQEVFRIKGTERVGRPIAAVGPLEQIRDFVDLELIDPDTREALFGDDGKFARFADTMRGLTFIRFPVRQDILEQNIIPQGFLQTEVDKTTGEEITTFQIWDSQGYGDTHEMIEYMRRLGVIWPAVTSFNQSGLPEITDAREGKDFCRWLGLPAYFSGRPNVRGEEVGRGSFSILSLTPRGVELTRHGNASYTMLAQALEHPIYYGPSAGVVDERLHEKLENYVPQELIPSLFALRARSQDADAMVQYHKLLEAFGLQDPPGADIPLPRQVVEQQARTTKEPKEGMTQHTLPPELLVGAYGPVVRQLVAGYLAGEEVGLLRRRLGLSDS